MSYSFFKQLTEDKCLPLSGTNIDGEDILLEDGTCEGNHYFRYSKHLLDGTYWVETYWEDGTEEIEQRSSLDRSEPNG